MCLSETTQGHRGSSGRICFREFSHGPTERESVRPGGEERDESRDDGWEREIRVSRSQDRHGRPWRVWSPLELVRGKTEDLRVRWSKLHSPLWWNRLCDQQGVKKKGKKKDVTISLKVDVCTEKSYFCCKESKGMSMGGTLIWVTVPWFKTSYRITHVRHIRWRSFIEIFLHRTGRRVGRKGDLPSVNRL